MGIPVGRGGGGRVGEWAHQWEGVEGDEWVSGHTSGGGQVGADFVFQAPFMTEGNFTLHCRMTKRKF